MQSFSPVWAAWNNDLPIIWLCLIICSGSSVEGTTLELNHADRLPHIISGCKLTVSCFRILLCGSKDEGNTTYCRLATYYFCYSTTLEQRSIIILIFLGSQSFVFNCSLLSSYLQRLVRLRWMICYHICPKMYRSWSIWIFYSTGGRVVRFKYYSDYRVRPQLQVPTWGNLYAMPGSAISLHRQGSFLLNPLPNFSCPKHVRALSYLDLWAFLPLSLLSPHLSPRIEAVVVLVSSIM